MKKIRWGILSTANINRRLIPAIHASSSGRLMAVASRDPEKAQAYALQWEIPQFFGSYEDLLNSDGIDAVYISLPNHLHAEWAIRALKAGKHVLCEKPFAVSVEEVDRMIAASQESGCVLAEAFMYRHHPQTKLVLDWVREGKLGEVNLVRGAFSFFMENRSGNVRLVPEYGGGALWDVGIYPLSFSQAVMGDKPVMVSGQQHLGPNGVDETFAGQMVYPKGQIAQITGSFESPLFTGFEIHGTAGRMTLNRAFTRLDEKGREIIFTSVKGDSEKIKVKSTDPYLGEVEDMHHAILEGAPTLIRLEESRNHVQTACALYESAQKQKPVKLSK